MPSAPGVERETEAQPEQDQPERKSEPDRAEEIRKEIAVIDARIEHLRLEVHRKGLTPPIDDGGRLVGLAEAEEALNALERDLARAQEAAAFRKELEKEVERFNEWAAKEKHRSEHAKPYRDEMVKLAQEKVILEHELKDLGGKVRTEEPAATGSSPRTKTFAHSEVPSP